MFPRFFIFAISDSNGSFFMFKFAYKPIKILNVMYDFIKQHEREVGRKMPGVLVLCVTTVPV